MISFHANKVYDNFRQFSALFRHFFDKFQKNNNKYNFFHFFGFFYDKSPKGKVKDTYILDYVLKNLEDPLKIKRVVSLSNLCISN